MWPLSTRLYVSREVPQQGTKTFQEIHCDKAFAKMNKLQNKNETNRQHQQNIAE